MIALLFFCCVCVQIVCEGVEYRSATFDPFLDLSLEITKANNLTRALQHFTAEEVLDGDNRYRCPKNNKLVSAGRCWRGSGCCRGGGAAAGAELRGVMQSKCCARMSAASKVHY